MQKRKTRERPPVGLWEAARDVLIASFSKGQFPLLLVAVIIVSAILRMPQQDVAQFTGEVIRDFEKLELLGYVLALLLAGAWFLHSRYQRKFLQEEIKRVSEERNRLQEKLSGHTLGSSKERG